MRMLNYATSNANPYHKDHRSASTGLPYSKAAPTMTSYTPTAKTKTRQNYRFGKHWVRNRPAPVSGSLKPTLAPQVNANPPQTIYASTKDPRSNNDNDGSFMSEDADADTYSEMTFSLATPSSSSSTIVCNDSNSHATCDHSIVEQDVEENKSEDSITHSPQLVVINAAAKVSVSDPNRIRLNPSCQSSSRCETMRKGKFGGMTLQETLNWRRRIADSQSKRVWKGMNSFGNMDSGSSSSQTEDPTLAAIRASAKVKRQLMRAKAKTVIEQEDKRKESPPDFLKVRAQLKKAKCNVSHCDTSIHSSVASVECDSETSQYGSTTATTSHETSDSFTTSGNASTPSPMCAPKYLIISSASEDSVDVKCVSTGEAEQNLSVHDGVASEDLCRSSSAVTDQVQIQSDVFGEDEEQGPNGTGSLDDNSVAVSTCIHKTIPVTPSPLRLILGTSTSSVLPIEKQDDVRVKLNAIFAQRQSHVVQQEGEAYGDNDESTVFVNDEDERDLNQDASPAETPKDFNSSQEASTTEYRIDLKDSKHEIHTKLNTMLSLRERPALSLRKESPEAVCIKTSSDCRDDVEQDKGRDSNRDLAQSPENTTKYSKMLSMGIPEGAVKNCMLRDGMDPSILFRSGPSEIKRTSKTAARYKRDPFRRTRLHWDEIDNFSEDSIWQKIKADDDLEWIIIDDVEFKTLFQSKALSPAKHCRSVDVVNERAVKVIDPKRANNGCIVLARIRMSYDDIAKGIKAIDDSILTPQQIAGVMDYIPTYEERNSLQSFISKGNDIETLCECEKFMVAIMSVYDAKKKMEAMLFKLRYPVALKELASDIDTLSKACDDVLDSIRLRKVMGAILKIGNRLNCAGVENSKTGAEGFTIESLPKLNEVKTNKKTTLMFYIASILHKWNSSLLSVKDELPHVLEAQKLPYETTLKTLEDELEGMHQSFNSCDPEGKPDENSLFLRKASVSISKVREASNHLDSKFELVRCYFSLDNTVKPNALFGMLTSFCNDLASVRVQVVKMEKRKQIRSLTRKSFGVGSVGLKQ